MNTLCSGAPLDDTMHSAGGRLSIVLDDEEEMDYRYRTTFYHVISS